MSDNNSVIKLSNQALVNFNSAQYTRVWMDWHCGSLSSSEQIEATGGGPKFAGQEPHNSPVFTQNYR
jgi:hypothetical protein